MIKNRKAGVAVIIVLGILALLMVLAVAFSVTMRVERTGAANYNTAVNSRQLAWAGLARAVADINATTPEAYPPGDFMVSRSAGAAWGSNGGGGITLATGRVRDYIPGVLLPVSDTAVSEWIRLRPSDGMGGHVAYMVLNVSDLLDAHHVGGDVRAGGTNAAELVLAGFSPAIDTNILVESRQRLAGTGGYAAYEIANRYPYFESLAEFRALATNLPAEVFVEYSRFLPDGNRTNVVNIGGGVDEVQTNRVDIMSRWSMAGGVLYPAERPTFVSLGQMFTNLIDYIDEDSIPGNLAAPNGEAVPLLNEVSLDGLSRLEPTRFRGQFRVETWFPFVKPNRSGHSFAVRYNYSVAVTVAEPDATNTYRVVTNGVSSAFSPAPMSFYTMDRQFQAPISLVPTNTLHVDIQVAVSNLAVVLAGSSTVVDSATNVVLAFHYSGPYAFNPVLAPESYQVTDPRLNWRSADWASGDTATMGTTNLTTLAYWQANPQFAKGFPLYVADRGYLYSPLEMGNLMIPGSNRELAPWSTFRVFNQGPDAPRHPLLEHFAVHPPDVRRGLVNVNTLDASLLAAAFREMPHPYGEPGDPVLSDGDAAAAAGIIVAARGGGTTFSNVTEILDLDWRAGSFANRSDLDLEGMAAYSTGLMGARQNLFLIVTAGSAGEEAMGVRGRQSVRTQARKVALALVWRDPKANAEGRHECFVRYFKWMDD